MLLTMVTLACDEKDFVVDKGGTSKLRMEFKPMKFNNTEYYFAEVIETKEAVGVTYLSKQVVTVMRVTDNAISAEYIDPFTGKEMNSVMTVDGVDWDIYREPNTGVIVRLYKKTNGVVAILSALKHLFMKPKVEIL